MLRDTAVARVKQMLGFKKNLDAEIVQAMIEIQDDLELSSELPDFLRKQIGLVTIANNSNVPVPTDFIREWEQNPMIVIDADGVQHNLFKDEPTYLRLRYPVEDGPGLPKGYNIFNISDIKYFSFYPTPDAIYTIGGTWYTKDADLSTNIENKWMKELPFLLIARSGLLLAAGLRDKDALASFGQMNDIFTAKLHLMTTADDAAGAKPVIGGED